MSPKLIVQNNLLSSKSTDLKPHLLKTPSVRGYKKNKIKKSTFTEIYRKMFDQISGTMAQSS
jgi:hypothetical protein